jgi:hypothetical protein
MNLLLRSAMIFFATLMVAALVALADPAAVASPTVSHADPAPGATQMATQMASH